MRWEELLLEVEAGAAETVAGVLLSLTDHGVAVERASARSKRWTVRAYWLDIGHNDRIKPLIEQELDRLRPVYSISVPQYRVVEDDTWWNTWKIDLYAVRAGRAVYICPPHAIKQASPGDTVLVLEASVAFGSGLHPSTNTMLAALEEARDEIQGAQAFDLGCGSGILGIAALKMGVAHVLSVDIDPKAIRSTALNLAANSVAEQVDVQLGSLDIAVQAGLRFDLLMANILGPVIIGMCDKGLADVLRPGGLGLFAGIRDDGLGQIDKVDAALRRVGLIPYRRRLVDHWAVIETHRQN